MQQQRSRGLRNRANPNPVAGVVGGGAAGRQRLRQLQRRPRREVLGVAGRGGGARQLGMRHTRTLKMADDVLCCRVSADGRLLAVALLDSTIQARALPGRAPTDTHPDSDRRSEKAEDIMGRALTRSWKALRCARREL